jgi:hypothetical protein
MVIERDISSRFTSADPRRRSLFQRDIVKLERSAAQCLSPVAGLSFRVKAVGHSKTT